MRRCIKTGMYACIQMTVFMQMHRAPARSEKKRSGIELSWRAPNNMQRTKPAVRRSEAESSCHGGTPQQHAKDKARSEKKRSGNELSWRDSPTTCKGQSPQREEAKRNRAGMVKTVTSAPPGSRNFTNSARCIMRLRHERTSPGCKNKEAINGI